MLNKPISPAASVPEYHPSVPQRHEAEAAVELLLRWAGDDPQREGLRDTPARVVRAFEDWFSGYATDPSAFLARTFEEVEGYDEMIVLQGISFESHCEHHLAPIIGQAHVGYLPSSRVVGISKLARVVEAYARRLQVQEKMTAQIAQCIQTVLQPRGVGVVIESSHQCMTTRGGSTRLAFGWSPAPCWVRSAMGPTRDASFCPQSVVDSGGANAIFCFWRCRIFCTRVIETTA